MDYREVVAWQELHEQNAPPPADPHSRELPRLRPWQNDDGTPAIWLMDGMNAVGTGAAGSFNPGPSWRFKDTGDFNSDGKSDILWQNDDGTPAIWLMDGTNTTFAGAVGPFNPGPSWEIKGTGDFNGDGKSDIIWQGDDGTAAMWLMDGTNTTFAGAVGPFNPGPSWEIKGTGDFNGDGKSDIIWQGDDGTAAMWLMDGTNTRLMTVWADPAGEAEAQITENCGRGLRICDAEVASEQTPNQVCRLEAGQRQNRLAPRTSRPASTAPRDTAGRCASTSRQAPRCVRMPGTFSPPGALGDCFALATAVLQPAEQHPVDEDSHAWCLDASAQDDRRAA